MTLHKNINLPVIQVIKLYHADIQKKRYLKCLSEKLKKFN